MNDARSRARDRGGRETAPGPVVYWMQRDQRVADNWALLYAQEMALAFGAPLLVVFNRVSRFGEAQAPHFSFMMAGLVEVAQKLQSLSIPFILREGEPQETIPSLVRELGAGMLVTDFSPLSIADAWKRAVFERISCAWHEVDTHNIVPCWVASPKEEYAARTFRSRMGKIYAQWKGPIPALMRHPFKAPTLRSAALTAPYGSSYPWIVPGEKAALTAMKRFVADRLEKYGAQRNDPTAGAVSDLSPYLHFGMLSAQRLATEVEESEAPSSEKEAFLEELIIRKELSDNFCHYQTAYDSFDGLRTWAKTTLDAHRSDQREFIYTLAEFETAATHDPLWNAAQEEMILRGKMHGYMRMYWAKKILEWSPSPEEAIATAITLNDRYSLDGRDPNGYVGILWSIGGVHDRPWFERPIYGTIRYMSESGCRRKFDVDAYIARVASLRHE
jgi:deoxyribodipyrimidine photo-lyase